MIYYLTGNKTLRGFGIYTEIICLTVTWDFCLNMLNIYFVGNKWVKIDNSTFAYIKINGTDDGRYSVLLKKQPRHRYHSKLVIQNTQVSDSGTYKCRVGVRWSAVIERQYRVHVQGKLQKHQWYLYTYIFITMADQG